MALTQLTHRRPSMTPSKLKTLLTVALVVIAWQAATDAGPLAGLAGRGRTNFGILQISVVTLPDGSAIGHSTLTASTCMPGGDCDAVGPVLQAVAPDDPRDFWCITVRRTEAAALPDLRINWYIRNTGNGRTSFDEVSFRTDFGMDCELFPDPSQPFRPLVSGDFRDVPLH